MAAIGDVPPPDEQSLHYLDEPVHPDVVALTAYWHEKRGARAMPDRGDISPGEIVRFLPNISISEAIDGGRDFRLRIFGTALVALIGREATGMLYSELAGDPRVMFRPVAARSRLLALSKTAFQLRRPVFASGRFVNMIHRSLEWHSFSSPLTAGGGDIAQMFGAVFVVERPEV
ncbi:PAS domain-containing protein [Parvibaculum sp.]|uniref:PAS domain-containing protein n=1 Tax=Parvibaculum sp. TaxID=2024848 RepID=UPI002C96113B|nr:PAS domain-containing protein [Parvibaculum sp.]HUD52919.1 PAS domain-containing protein [Parvibaculum sp.]